MKPDFNVVGGNFFLEFDQHYQVISSVTQFQCSAGVDQACQFIKAFHKSDLMFNNIVKENTVLIVQMSIFAAH